MYTHKLYKWQRGTILIINFSRHGNTGNKQDRYVLFLLLIYMYTFLCVLKGNEKGTPYRIK